MAQRGLSQFRVVIFYISLLLWPHPSRLNLNHDFPPSFSLLEPVTTLPAIAAIMAVLVLGIFLAKKQRLISFCILWYFGNLVIESSIIALELVFEHRNYMPSMLVVFLVVFLSFRHLKPKWITPLILLVVAAVFATWTYQRNDVWRSPLLVWKDSVQKSPHSPRPLNNLGVALADYGQYAEAAQYYHKALEIDPNYVNAHANLGYAVARQGRLEEAVVHLQTALKINPNYYEAQTNMGIVYAMQEKYQDAVRHLRYAINLKPHYANAYNNLGVTLKRMGSLEEAVEHLTTAIKIDPLMAPAHNNLGMILAGQGHLDEAIAHFNTALMIDPNYKNARLNLQESLEKRNQSTSAPQK
jgi:tetratricopeptide (TPR) repeat protein